MGFPPGRIVGPGCDTNPDQRKGLEAKTSRVGIGRARRQSRRAPITPDEALAVVRVAVRVRDNDFELYRLALQDPHVDSVDIALCVLRPIRATDLLVED